jgi:gas vesicle protein
MNKKNLVLLLLAGAALGLLLGTDKGKKLQKKWKKKGMDMADNLKSKMNRYAEEKV